MMSDAQLEAMLTARQVSDFLQVSISTVRRWSSSGMLKCYRVGSRGDRRYQRDDVLRFLQEPTGFPQPDSTHSTVPHRGKAT
ncbi:MAG: helix-turn-helix domain-containing protein [Dehalococcoidia bacterium]